MVTRTLEDKFSTTPWRRTTLSPSNSNNNNNNRPITNDLSLTSEKLKFVWHLQWNIFIVWTFKAMRNFVFGAISYFYFLFTVLSCLVIVVALIPLALRSVFETCNLHENCHKSTTWFLCWSNFAAYHLDTRHEHKPLWMCINKDTSWERKFVVVTTRRTWTRIVGRGLKGDFLQ